MTELEILSNIFYSLVILGAIFIFFVVVIIILMLKK